MDFKNFVHTFVSFFLPTSLYYKLGLDIVEHIVFVFPVLFVVLNPIRYAKCVICCMLNKNACFSALTYKLLVKLVYYNRAKSLTAVVET